MRLHATCLLVRSSSKPRQETYLKGLGPFCHPLLSSILILTHLNIISSPPLKSMPNCTISPSFTGYGFDSVPGRLRRIWLRKVPDELLTSLIYQRPFEYQNSQCRLLTTLDLNPTGALEGAFAAWGGCVSRSEYLPTFMTSVPLGNIRDMGLNASEGLVARGSWWAVNRMEGSWWDIPFALPASV